METPPIGLAQSWLDVVAATLGPLIALIVGFEGTDWFLRRRLGAAPDHSRLGEAEGTGN